MANECIPLYDDGDKVSVVCTVAVTGKKFVDITTAGFDAVNNSLQVALPTAGGTVFGIAGRDAPIGALVDVIRVGNPLVVPATTGATVTAGQRLQVDATGAVVPLITAVSAAPVITLGTTASTGGTFAAATYFWKLTSLNGTTESAGSNEVTAAIAANGTQVINWTAVTGATGYRLYRGTVAGAENVLVTTIGSGATVTFTDTGAAGTAGSPPAVAPVAGVAVARALTTGTTGTDVFISLSAN